MAHFLCPVNAFEWVKKENEWKWRFKTSLTFTDFYKQFPFKKKCGLKLRRQQLILLLVLQPPSFQFLNADLFTFHFLSAAQEKFTEEMLYIVEYWKRAF